MSEKPLKRLRRAYTNKCKLEHLDILEKKFSNNTDKMSSETGIPRRTLRNWVVEFSKLRTFAGSPDVRKIVVGPKARYPNSFQNKSLSILSSNRTLRFFTAIFRATKK